MPFVKWLYLPSFGEIVYVREVGKKQ